MSDHVSATALARGLRRLRGRRLVTACVASVLVTCVALPRTATAQGTQGTVDATGELVRLPDVMADVSVTFHALDVVPPGLWLRMRGMGEIELVSNADVATTESVHRRISEVAEVRELAATDSPDAIAGVGVFVTVDGDVRLVWRGRMESEAIQILAEARRAVDALELTVLIPHAGIIGDMWGLQADLSRSGIRSVRFVAVP